MHLPLRNIWSTASRIQILVGDDEIEAMTGESPALPLAIDFQYCGSALCRCPTLR